MIVRLEQRGSDVLVPVKVVPGSSREDIAGALGERLKVRTRAPAEDGRANRAVCALLAAALGVKTRDVAIASGAGRPDKVVRIRGISTTHAAAALGLSEE
jgi:hypothetical protein